jgi:hypothetical protein
LGCPCNLRELIDAAQARRQSLSVTESHDICHLAVNLVIGRLTRRMHRVKATRHDDTVLAMWLMWYHDYCHWHLNLSPPHTR